MSSIICLRLISLSILPSVYPCSCKFYSCLWLSSNVCVCIFIHSSVDEFLVLVNVPLWALGCTHLSWSSLFFLIYIPRNVMEFVGYTVVQFLVFWGTFHSVFHSGCTALHAHQQSTWVPSPCPHQHLLYVLFLMIAILTSLRGVILLWFLTAFHWLLAMSNHFSCGYWPSAYPFWKKCLIQFYWPFFNQVAFMLLSFMNCSYMLDIDLLLVISLTNIFSHSVHCLFILWMVSFAVQSL